MNAWAKAAALTGAGPWETVTDPSLGLPRTVVSDGPHGLRRQDENTRFEDWGTSVPSTCFPPASALAAGWDETVLTRVGEAIAAEARALGVSVVLGPGVNIKRNPLCGRNFEYFSEDPLLTGVLATAYVKAVEGVGVGTSLKHFAANNQETDRMEVSAEVDERTLREIYLPAFERVVKQARPSTVMAAYNRLNGTFCSQHRWLLTDVLRGEWGFEGAVVSDWGATHDRVAALQAGLDLAMPGPNEDFTRSLAEAVEQGVLREAELDAAVDRVRALHRVAADHRESVDFEAHHALSRAIAAECVVLLKNEDGVLPLARDARVAVLGRQAVDARFQGGGSSHVNATRVDQPLAELQALGHAVTFVDDADREGLDAALRGNDVAVVFAGLHDVHESEGVDRRHLDLPPADVALVRAVAATGLPTVVVLTHGSVVLLEGWVDQVAGVVDAGLLGQGGGHALARLIFGLADPSGRLAETIPYRLPDNPSWLNFPGENGHVRYGEGVLVGYRYHATAEVGARYPFGHGLSYTTFATTLVSAVATGPTSATATVRVTNTGHRAGKEVVQLYVAPPEDRVRRPRRELRAFAKVALAPGESAERTFDLDLRAFAYWDTLTSSWSVSPGVHLVQVCSDALTVIDERPVTLAGNRVVPRLTLDSRLADLIGHPVAGPAFLAGMAEQAPDALDTLKAIGYLPVRTLTEFSPDAFPVSALTALIHHANQTH